jgi:hypothetical protein
MVKIKNLLCNVHAAKEEKTKDQQRGAFKYSYYKNLHLGKNSSPRWRTWGMCSTITWNYWIPRHIFTLANNSWEAFYEHKKFQA